MVTDAACGAALNHEIAGPKSRHGFREVSMAEFMNEPVVTLLTQEDVREAMLHQRKECCGYKGSDIYRIKSAWLISLIEEIVATGQFPYNADIKKLAEQRLGLPAKPEAEYSQEGDVLSLLIYNAQNYRRSDKLIADGYQPFTPELLQRAHEEGRTLELFSTGLMGSSVFKLNVRKIGNELYAMRPKKRKEYIPPRGQPVRLVGPLPTYAQRVRRLELEGLTTSDAQAVADAEDQRKCPHGAQPGPCYLCR
jgi:hypothetical protein